MYLVRGGSRGTGDAAPPASDDGHPAGGPSAGLLLTEPIRGLADLATLLLAAPGLAAAPRGDGHGVLVFPGLLAGDSSTVPLRAFLRWLGYDVRGWDLGRNHGPTEAVLAGLPRAVLDHAMTDRAARIAGGLEPGRRLRQGDGTPASPAGPPGHHPGQPLRLDRPEAEPRPWSLPAPQFPARPRHQAAQPRAAVPADRRAVDVGLLPLGRCRGLASVRRARDGAAREHRGPLQPRRLRRGSGDVLADRRPAGRAGRPASPVPPAAGAAAAVPRPR